MKECTYTVLMPVLNEESCLEDIVLRVHKVLTDLNEGFEILCVDDGSSDRTWDILQRLHKEKPQVRGVRFQRNFGHQLALFAGLKYASGRWIAIIDADGQDPPEILPRFFQKAREGYDVVYAIREKRKESAFKRTCYALFYRFYKRIVPFQVPLDSGDFAVISRDVAKFISGLPERNPFIRGLRSWYGGRQIGLPYERSARAAGEPKYSYFGLIKLAVNASISFSKVPLRMISTAGIMISCLSFLGGFIILLMKLTIGIDIGGWTSMAMLVIFFGGLNLFVLGIIGEYIGDIFDEVKNRPAYLVEQTIGMG